MPTRLHPRRHRSRPSLRDWDGLAEVPAGPRTALGAVVAERLFRAAIGRLDVTVQIAGRPRLLGRGGPTAIVHDADELFRRLGRDGLIGFGEAYLTGAWDAPDLGGFLTVLAAEVADLVPPPLQRLRSAFVRRPPAEERSSVTNSRSNIAHHYDLSNELFATFLDSTWSYSSALFAPEPARSEQSLASAQVRKIERLLDATGVGPGTRVLEIGTGWGELAIRAARRGATVESITLSSEQWTLARQRVEEAGVSERVRLDLRDYRALPRESAYDVVLSVEMIEAVGHQYWSEYFACLAGCLAPGGRIGLQAITMPHDRMLATRRTWTWINKYIFPGGFLPSVQAIEEHAAAVGLRIVDDLAFGEHYAETLRRWDLAFLDATDRVAALGFDEVFCRMWHFYLEYSRAGFASGYLDAHQLVLTGDGS